MPKAYWRDDRYAVGRISPSSVDELHVTDDADDLVRLVVAEIQDELPADRVVARIDLPREGFVDHGHRILVRRIALVDVAAGEQRNLHRREIAGGHRPRIDHRPFVRRRLRRIGAPERRARANAGQRQERRAADGSTSGSARSPSITRV